MSTSAWRDMSNYIGRDILLVMQENATAQSIRSAFMNLGFWVTVTADLKVILDLLDNKFFICTLLELDTPKPGYGLKIAQRIIENSPVTACYILSPRADFAALLSAHRMGIKDFIPLEGDFLPYLSFSVRKSASEIEHVGERDRLLKDMVQVHGKFLKQMIQLHIKLMETEEALRPGVPDEELPPCKVLVVDPEDRLVNTLRHLLPETSGWEWIHLAWGGEALDFGTGGAFHMGLISRNLPDLPGSMVFQTLRANDTQAPLFLFDTNKQKPTELVLFEHSTSKEMPLQIQDPEQLAQRLCDLRRGLDSSRRKSEHLKTFKAQHYDFLQEYQRIQTKAKKVLQFDEKPET